MKVDIEFPENFHIYLEHQSFDILIVAFHVFFGVSAFLTMCSPNFPRQFYVLLGM
jgi:hypothetical protein